MDRLFFFDVKKNDMYEMQLFSLLLTIKKCPALVCGCKSFSRVYQYVCGYATCFEELKQYHFYFFEEFYKFLCITHYEPGGYGIEGIIGIGRSDEDALDYFFEQLEKFFAEKGIKNISENADYYFLKSYDALQLLANGASGILKNGYSLLHFAAKTADFMLAETLIKEHRISTNQIDKTTGNTPLICLLRSHEHNASEKDLLLFAQMLIDNGADIYMTNNDGKTAYDYAIENDYIEIARMLAPK